MLWAKIINDKLYKYYIRNHFDWPFYPIVLAKSINKLLLLLRRTLISTKRQLTKDKVSFSSVLMTFPFSAAVLSSFLLVRKAKVFVCFLLNALHFPHWLQNTFEFERKKNRGEWEVNRKSWNKGEIWRWDRIKSVEVVYFQLKLFLEAVIFTRKAYSTCLADWLVA